MDLIQCLNSRSQLFIAADFSILFVIVILLFEILSVIQSGIQKNFKMFGMKEQANSRKFQKIPKNSKKLQKIQLKLQKIPKRLQKIQLKLVHRAPLVP